MRISDWSSDVCSSDLKQRITELNATPYMLDGTRFRIEEGIDFGVLYLDRFARTLDEVANQVPEGRTADELFAVNNQGFVVRRSRSEEHTSELQSLMRISYAVFCLKKKNNQTPQKTDER